MPISLSNNTNYDLPPELEQVAHDVLQAESAEKGDLSVAAVSEERMHNLNRHYRGEDKPTNVLAFRAPPAAGDSDELGEVVLCPAVIEHEAREGGYGMERGLVFCMIHGILHILGYTHEDGEDTARMERQERRYLQAFV